MSSGSRTHLDSFHEASRPFVEALRRSDPAARAVALQEIAPIVDDALARELLRFARDSDGVPEERGQALIALGPALEETSWDEDEDGNLADAGDGEDWWDTPLSGAGYREIHDELRRIYHDGGQPKEVRRRALEAAVRAARPWHRDAVATAWGSGDAEWRLTAVFAMGYLAGFDDEIEEAFRGDDPAVRREAMRSAGRGELEHLAPELLEIAADTGADPADRVAALGALGELHQEDAWEVLEELTADANEDVSVAARDTLEELRTWEAVGEGEEGFGLDDLEELDWDD